MSSRNGALSESSSDFSGSDSSTEESSSDWDVTSSDNSSSDNTTLDDIYGGLPMLSPSISMSQSYRSAEFTYDFPYDYGDDTLTNERNAKRNHYRSQTTAARIRSHSHDIIDRDAYDRSTSNDAMPERIPFLVKMRSNTQVHTFRSQTIDNNDNNDDNNESNKIEENNAENEDDLHLDLEYYLYSLFYPYTNYQALLFAQPFLYKKEKKSKKKVYEEEPEEEEEEKSTQITMNWNNVQHIERISGLITRLLKTAGTKGIEELALYQMFSSPSPQRIIYELRFGLYSALCLTHLDRFGRRTFYYVKQNEDETDEFHFHENLIADINVFNEVDVIGLADFIGDDTPLDTNINNSINNAYNNINQSATQQIIKEDTIANVANNNNNLKPEPIETDDENCDEEDLVKIIKKIKSRKTQKKTKYNKQATRKRAITQQSSSAHSTPRSKQTKHKSVKKKRLNSVSINSKRKPLKKRTVTTTKTITTKRIIRRSKKKSSEKRRNTVNSIVNTTNRKRLKQKQKQNVAKYSGTKQKRNNHNYNNNKHIQTTRRRNKKADDISSILSTNYSITALFKRRLSKQNEKLLHGLRDIQQLQQEREKKRQHYKNSQSVAVHKVHKTRSPKIRRKRRITIEEMGGGNWCTIQLNHQFLVSGFVRRATIKLLFANIVIPLSIVTLIGMFYYCSSHLVLISGSMECKNAKHNQLHILGISNKKRYKIKLNRLSQNTQLNNVKSEPTEANTTDNKKKKRNDTHSLTVDKKKMKQLKNRKKKRSVTPKPAAIHNKTQIMNNNNNNNTKKASKKIKRSMRDVSLSRTFDRYALGSCFTSSLSVPHLPWLQKKFERASIDIHHRGKYSMIIRSGGTYTSNESVSSDNDLIIFNSKHLYPTHSNKKRNTITIEVGAKHRKRKSRKRKTKYKYDNIEIVKYDKPKIINGYYCKLPSFRREIEYLNVVYNEYKCSLFAFGGLNLGKCCKRITELSLCTQTFSEIKWKKGGTLKKARYSCSLVESARDQIAVIGGLDKDSREMRNVEFYNIYSHETISAALMHEGRSNCGTCVVNDLNNGTIIVGGGVKYGDASKQIELFDAQKNNWNIHCAKTNYKHSFPTIWSDQINPNIVYIAGDNIGISGGGRNASLGFIEWCDLRESKKNKLFNVLYENSIDRLWRFRFLRKNRDNAWESRALFCM